MVNLFSWQEKYVVCRGKFSRMNVVSKKGYEKKMNGFLKKLNNESIFLKYALGPK